MYAFKSNVVSLALTAVVEEQEVDEMAERVKVGVGANANDDGATVTAARTPRGKERRIVEKCVGGRRDLTMRLDRRIVWSLQW
jgi:hypothetical protein